MMPKPLTYFSVTRNDTIIGPNVVAIGDISCKDDIIIDGQASGSVTTPGNITIGLNAAVHSNLRAHSALIAGSVEGDVILTGECIVQGSGTVVGNITATSLTILPGGVLNGCSRVINAS